MHTKKLTALLHTVFAMSLFGTTACTDFLSTGSDPNRSQTAGSKQLFVGIQAAMWATYGSDISRMAAMFTQQAEGVDGAYVTLYQYTVTEGTTNESHTALYSAGGLIDIRNLKQQAEENEDFMFVGVAQVQEALVMGFGADIWGDLVYSEALQGGNPPLDDQMDIYQALLIQLDSAIDNINSTAITSTGPEESDLVYWTGSAPADRAAQKAKWTRLAHSLKARIYMHMAEVNPANYALALAEAPLGILDPADDYQSTYSGNAGETNLLYQFTVEQRPGYIRPTEMFATLLDTLNDPRYNQYIDASGPSLDYAVAFTDRQTPQKIMTAAETRLIWAEAAYRGGATTAGGTAGTQLANYRTAYGYSTITPAPSGANLLRRILTEKYIALFHQVEAYNDYKRTCYPNFAPTVPGGSVPARLFYDANERNTNPNVPPPSAQPARNANDPPNATDPFGNPCLATTGGS